MIHGAKQASSRDTLSQTDYLWCQYKRLESHTMDILQRGRSTASLWQGMTPGAWKIWSHEWPALQKGTLEAPFTSALRTSVPYTCRLFSKINWGWRLLCSYFVLFPPKLGFPIFFIILGRLFSKCFTISSLEKTSINKMGLKEYSKTWPADYKSYKWQKLVFRLAASLLLLLLLTT